MTELSDSVVREDHGGTRVLNYKVRPRNLHAILQASADKYADKNAFECRSGNATFGKFLADVECFAAAMQDRLKIKKGDRVALLLDNDLAFPLTFFAAARIGAVAVPINIRFVSIEIAYILKDSGARAVFVDPIYMSECSRAAKTAPDLEHIISTGRSSGAADGLHLEDLIKNASGKADEVDVDENDLAAIFYTSGTTGEPKGAMCTHRNFIANAINSHVTVGSTPDDRGLVCVPLCHPTACHSQMISAIYLGSTCVILPRFNADETLTAIETSRITTLVGVPTVHWLLLTQIKLKDYDLDTLTNIIYGGAPASPELVRRLREAFPSVRLGNGYGLTETSSMATFLPDEYAMEKPDSVGPPVPTVELRIVDEGIDLPPGKIGEIVLKGANVVDGYWRDPRATAEVFKDGWFYSGDLGRVDEEGFLHIVDRKKDMIIRGGENIYSVEIESALESHPDVFEAAAVGRADKVFGEQVMAYIVRNPGSRLTADEILDFCDKRLADFKVPKYIEFVDELPRNPAGKIDKRTLRS